jgi:hypothetical protein
MCDTCSSFTSVIITTFTHLHTSFLLHMSGLGFMARADLALGIEVQLCVVIECAQNVALILDLTTFAFFSFFVSFFFTLL